MTIPHALPAEPLISGDYGCVVVRSRQECQTAIAALQHLPNMRMVIVTEPHCLRGLAIPANILLLTNLSPNSRLNVLQYSRFVVVPLSDKQPCCDYEILVTAMQFGKALITADVPSISDYAFHNSNAVLYPLDRPEALTKAICDLWHDPNKSNFLGSNGKGFAETFCSEAVLQSCFHQFLVRKGF